MVLLISSEIVTCLTFIELVFTCKSEEKTKVPLLVIDIASILVGVFLFIASAGEVDKAYSMLFSYVIVTIVQIFIFLLNIFVYIWNTKRSNHVFYMEKFYKDCLATGIESIDSEKNKQRAKLIAEKYGLKCDDILSLFNEAKILYKKEESNNEINESNEKLKNLRKKEQQEYNQCIKYLNKYGREKRIAYYSDERDQYLRWASEEHNKASNTINAVTQKESDWAVLGGVANAIAGPGVGAVTALNTQANNARIRARNEENLKIVQPILSRSYGYESDFRSKAEEFDQLIEETKMKLVLEDSNEICMNHLRFFDSHIEVSDTGACTVYVDVTQTEQMYIFDDVIAVIDGSIKAEIIDDNQKIVGVAMLVIPNIGVQYNKLEHLKAICLKGFNKESQYSIKLTPNKLWAVEL